MKIGFPIKLNKKLYQDKFRESRYRLAEKIREIINNLQVESKEEREEKNM